MEVKACSGCSAATRGDERDRALQILKDVDGYIAEGRMHHARYMIAVALSGTKFGQRAALTEGES